MPSSGMLRCVVVLRTDVSEERSSIIKVKRFGGLGAGILYYVFLRSVRRLLSRLALFLLYRVLSPS
jgi:hypothetical protein